MHGKLSESCDDLGLQQIKEALKTAGVFNDDPDLLAKAAKAIAEINAGPHMVVCNSGHYCVVVKK